MRAIAKILVKAGPTLNSSDSDQIATLTENYYSTIKYDFGFTRPPQINHLMRVKEKVRQLILLQDVCELETTLVNAVGDFEERNPVEVLQEELLAHIKVVDQ